METRTARYDTEQLADVAHALTGYNMSHELEIIIGMIVRVIPAENGESMVEVVMSFDSSLNPFWNDNTGDEEKYVDEHMNGLISFIDGYLFAKGKK